MTWNNCFSPKRFGMQKGQQDIRTQYERDWDRIIFSIIAITSVSRRGEKFAKFPFFFNLKNHLNGKYVVAKFIVTPNS